MTVTPALYSSSRFWVISITCAATASLPVVRMACARVWPTTSRMALCDDRADGSFLVGHVEEEVLRLVEMRQNTENGT